MAEALDFVFLKEFLEEKFELFNQPSFIESDPISIPHRYSRKEDREIAGLMTAIISWGRRPMIVRAAEKLMERMDDAPFEFVVGASDREFAQIESFVYRTFQGVDPVNIVRGLQRIYRDLGGLEAVMRPPTGATDTLESIMQLRKAMGETEGFAQRTFKHLSNPSTGSSAKRINMFLRWMVRDDRRGVDFGVWKTWKPAQLVCPLDVHSGSVARELGLLTRKQDNWKSAMELTENLRKMSPEDPVRYDFSLFGLGIIEKFISKG